MVAHPRTHEFIKRLNQRYTSPVTEIEEDVAEYRDLTHADNDAVVVGLARSAMEVLRGRADFAEAMREVDPPAADYEALMHRLRDRKRT